jgi:hypothetical protein
MSQKPWLLRQVEAFVHTQLVPMNEVTIQHNKERMWPHTILVNESGQEFVALVESIDENTIVVKLNRAVIFTAYIY